MGIPCEISLGINKDTGRRSGPNSAPPVRLALSDSTIPSLWCARVQGLVARAPVRARVLGCHPRDVRHASPPPGGEVGGRGDPAPILGELCDHPTDVQDMSREQGRAEVAHCSGAKYTVAVGDFFGGSFSFFSFPIPSTKPFSFTDSLDVAADLFTSQDPIVEGGHAHLPSSTRVVVCRSPDPAMAARSRRKHIDKDVSPGTLHGRDFPRATRRPAERRTGACPAS